MKQMHLVKQFADLFNSKNIICIDADRSVASNTSGHGQAMRDCLTQGFDITPIKIIHNASVHYKGRWGGTTGKFLNAFMEIGHAFRLSPSNGNMILRMDEDFELEGKTTEVMVVGIATAFLCKALPCSLPEISKIVTTGARCDFEITRQSDTVIFEARGRQKRNQIKSAASRLPKKKAAKAANYIYGLITYVPRDSTPVELHIFDPPGDEDFKARSDLETELMYLRHYSSVTRLCGMNGLKSILDSRVRELEELNGKRKSSSQIDRLIYPLEKVWEIQPGFFSRLPKELEPLSYNAYRPPPVLEYKEPTKPIKKRRERVPHRYQEEMNQVELNFALKWEVIDSLFRLDIAKIIDMNFEAKEDKENLTSYAADGSSLKIDVKRNR